MDSRREALKKQLFYQAQGLHGATWVAPRPWGTILPFLDERGILICPLALCMYDRVMVATDLHEIIPWPWGSMAMKYNPSQPKLRTTVDVCTRNARLNAYWRPELVALVSNEMNLTVADSDDARRILLYYNVALYSKEVMRAAIDHLNELVRIQARLDLPEEER